MEEEKKITVNRDTAIEEFERWAKAWRIGRKMRNANQKDKEEFEERKNQIIDLMEDGQLMYEDDQDCLVYVFQFPTDARNMKEIKIRRPKGDALSSGDKYEERASVHRTYEILASMTGKEVAFFKGLDWIDLESLTAVMNVFLAS